MKHYLLHIILAVMWFWVGHFSAQDSSCKFGICNDPRACRIEWDEGSVQYKSREIDLGTLLQGESIIVNLFDPNDILSVSVSQLDNQTWMGERSSDVIP